MSHPGYPNALPVRAVMERLTEAGASALHEFWPDDISLLDARIADAARIHGPRQLTDVYLLALAVRHSGQFVTLRALAEADHGPMQSELQSGAYAAFGLVADFASSIGIRFSNVNPLFFNR